MAEDYEYRGMVAENWDLLRGDTSAWPDTVYYRGIIAAQGGPVLDVGCGTGRHTLDFLASGIDIDGVDNSPDMLAICRAKAAALGLDVGDRLFHQEMDQLALPRRYVVIFVPSLSFQLLLDPAAASRAMAAFRDHLAPGGLLVMSLNSKLWPGRRTPPQMQWSDWYATEAMRPEDGDTIRRWSRAQFDHDAQLVHEEHRFERLRGGAVIQEEHHARSPAVRWYSQDQAVDLYRQAGFADVRMTSRDSTEPASPEDTQFKIVGRGP
jgi:SAM-dependent methyltransferase